MKCKKKTNKTKTHPNPPCEGGSSHPGWLSSPPWGSWRGLGDYFLPSQGSWRGLGLERVLLFFILMLLCACSANNCPLESTVTCNYGFYDSEGVAVEYEDTISVRTLLPGMKTVYTYRKLGQRTVVLDKRDSTYIKNGYTETVSETRRDAVLASNVHNASSMKLEMSYYSKFDTLIFDYSSISNKDTVYLTHDSYSNVELPECGTHRFHHLKEIRCTHYGIDRIEIGNPDVNYKGNENVKVYFNGSADY